jgi:hypothetical protein
LFFFALCLASGLSLRFAPRHAKDDYRSAAGLARAALATGRPVWWSADDNAGAYYRLSFATNAQPGTAFTLVNPSAAVLATLAPADVVLVSLPDIYDPHGVLAGYLARNHYQKTRVLPAFAVLEKPAAK